jgi:hypothetical protein
MIPAARAGPSRTIFRLSPREGGSRRRAIERELWPGSPDLSTPPFPLSPIGSSTVDPGEGWGRRISSEGSPDPPRKGFGSEPSNPSSKADRWQVEGSRPRWKPVPARAAQRWGSGTGCGWLQRGSAISGRVPRRRDRSGGRLPVRPPRAGRSADSPGGNGSSLPRKPPLWLLWRRTGTQETCFPDRLTGAVSTPYNRATARCLIPSSLIAPCNRANCHA